MLQVISSSHCRGKRGERGNISGLHRKNRRGRSSLLLRPSSPPPPPQNDPPSSSSCCVYLIPPSVWQRSFRSPSSVSHTPHPNNTHLLYFNQHFIIFFFMDSPSPFPLLPSLLSSVEIETNSQEARYVMEGTLPGTF